jgi:hypothetical protein
VAVAGGGSSSVHAAPSAQMIRAAHAPAYARSGAATRHRVPLDGFNKSVPGNNRIRVYPV